VDAPSAGMIGDIGHGRAFVVTRTAVGAGLEP
jgi:hypothetical protein